MRECEQKIINNYEIDCKLTSFDCWTFIALLRDFNDFSFSDFNFYSAIQWKIMKLNCSLRIYRYARMNCENVNKWSIEA